MKWLLWNDYYVTKLVIPGILNKQIKLYWCELNSAFRIIMKWLSKYSAYQKKIAREKVFIRGFKFLVELKSSNFFSLFYLCCFRLKTSIFLTIFCQILNRACDGLVDSLEGVLVARHLPSPCLRETEGLIVQTISPTEWQECASALLHSALIPIYYGPYFLSLLLGRETDEFLRQRKDYKKNTLNYVFFNT